MPASIVVKKVIDLSNVQNPKNPVVAVVVVVNRVSFDLFKNKENVKKIF
jgi:hypothetical protein